MLANKMRALCLMLLVGCFGLFGGPFPVVETAPTSEAEDDSNASSASSQRHPAVDEILAVRSRLGGGLTRVLQEIEQAAHVDTDIDSAFAEALVEVAQERARGSSQRAPVRGLNHGDSQAATDGSRFPPENNWLRPPAADYGFTRGAAGGPGAFGREPAAAPPIDAANDLSGNLFQQPSHYPSSLPLAHQVEAGSEQLLDALYGVITRADSMANQLDRDSQWESAEKFRVLASQLRAVARDYQQPTPSDRSADTSLQSIPAAPEPNAAINWPSPIHPGPKSMPKRR